MGTSDGVKNVAPPSMLRRSWARNRARGVFMPCCLPQPRGDPQLCLCLNGGHKKPCNKGRAIGHKTMITNENMVAMGGLEPPTPAL